VTASIRSFPLTATSLFYRGDELFATTTVDKLDKDESIIGHSGALLRIAGAAPETIFKSKKIGLLSGAALASGAIAVGTTDSQILVMSPSGKVQRTIPSGLQAYQKPDFLVAGGNPEIVVVASRAYSNAKSSRAEQFDTTSWTQGKQLGFASLKPALSVSPRGIARCTGSGYASVDSWGLQEYRWKGLLKVIKTPTQRSSFCISAASGWLVSDSTTAAFVDLEGGVRWTVAESHAGGCTLSDTRLAIVSMNALVVVDVADGHVVESYPFELEDEESFVLPCPVAVSASGHVAIATEARVLIVERGAEKRDVAGSARLAVKAGPSQAAIASAAAAGKKAADRQARSASDDVVALEALTVEILKTEDVKALKKLRTKLGKLDVLESGGDPKNEKRIAKCEKSIRARMNALPPGSAASLELANFLDVLNDS
jgi:hypothetical protein